MRTFLLFLLAFSGLSLCAQERLTGVNVGDLAPEIAMPDPNGDTLRLSSLKGQVVLVDFWASWCRPCRMESPHVRHAYHTYNDRLFTNGKGFSVFSVSLDRAGGLAQWKKAIATDSLDWKWHVGDVTNGTPAAAQRYQVAFIPTNALIDGEGRVIRKDLHGEALEQALNALLQQDAKQLAAWGKEQRERAKAAAKQARKKKKGIRTDPKP
ncbi:MAG: TlpA disulfide reductase family protein [Flavobacteriales bacterium]